MNKLIFIFAALTLLGCATKHKMVETQDTEKQVEVRYEKEVVIDTFWLEIQPEKQSTVTDTSYSFLENSYSTSTAMVDSAGFLHHTLENKPQKKPIPVEKTTERKDSIAANTITIEKEVPVPREQTWWEKTQIYGFWAMFVLLVARILFKRIFKHTIKTS